MTRDDRNGKVGRYWLAKPREALVAARDEAAADRLINLLVGLADAGTP